MNDPILSTDADGTLSELARSLLESQRIAGLGSYTLDLTTMLWSSSEVLDEIFGINADYERSVDGWIALIHPEEQRRHQARGGAHVEVADDADDPAAVPRNDSDFQAVFQTAHRSTPSENGALYRVLGKRDYAAPRTTSKAE